MVKNMDGVRMIRVRIGDKRQEALLNMAGRGDDIQGGVR
jgi:hypothetical protein